MNLYRYGTGSNWHSARSNDLVYRLAPGQQEPAIHYNFPNFGNGWLRTSSFAVFATWGDVEAMITAFAANGHAEAIKLQEDRAAIARVRAALQPPD